MNYAADDFEAIRKRMDEFKRDREAQQVKQADPAKCSHCGLTPGTCAACSGLD